MRDCRVVLIRRRTWIAGVCFSVLLLGCSSLRFGYEHADWMLGRLFDDYLDLNETQEELFERRFGEFREWHRREALPDYADFLEQLRGRVQRGLVANDVDWFFNGVETRYRIAASRSAVDLASVLGTLSDGQVRYFESKLAESNREFAEERGLDADEVSRRDHGQKRLKERIEDWTGRLTGLQASLLAPFFKAMPVIDRPEFENRLRRQQELFRLLPLRREDAAFQPALKTWLTDFREGRSPDYERLMNRSRIALADLVLALDRLLTKDQRQRVVQRLSAMLGDFRSLAKAAE